MVCVCVLSVSLFYLSFFTHTLSICLSFSISLLLSVIFSSTVVLSLSLSPFLWMAFFPLSPFLWMASFLSLSPIPVYLFERHSVVFHLLLYVVSLFVHLLFLLCFCFNCFGFSCFCCLSMLSLLLPLLLFDELGNIAKNYGNTAHFDGWLPVHAQRWLVVHLRMRESDQKSGPRVNQGVWTSSQLLLLKCSFLPRDVCFLRGPRINL